MLKCTLIALMLTGAAIAQTGTSQPSTAACLSGPVTKGTLTVSCSVIDNSASAVASDATAGVPSSMILVNAASTDPDVVGVRITISCAWAGGDIAPGNAQRSGQITMPAPPPAGTAPVPTPFPLTYIFSNVTVGPSAAQSCASPIRVTAVTVQELKASTSASF